jgi:hypothetical protein
MHEFGGRFGRPPLAGDFFEGKQMERELPMRIHFRYARLLVGSIIACLLVLPAPAALAAPPGPGGGGKGNGGLDTIKSRDWGETPVRKILLAFAWGGLTSDAQIGVWAEMSPEAAVAEMLTFDVVNPALSPPGAGDDSSLHCGSLEELQDFWSGNDPGNIMKYADRYRYATLNNAQDLSTVNLQRTWTKAISTRGCNPFLYKMVLYLTNYHASISAHKTRAGLIRAYHDDIMQALISGADFVDVMRIAASHAAVARAYGHQYSRYYNGSETFRGTDDFGREFHQLFFRIQGDTEDMAYHEDTTIEHTAWMLSGMNLEKVTGAYGSDRSSDWWVAPIAFEDYTDDTGRNIRNRLYHYHNPEGAGSCLEILHADICGATADEKIAALAPVAAAHPESMDNVPVYMIDFFADDNLDAGKIAALRSAWADAGYDILSFIRAYAISTAFHSADTYKYRTAFDRNLVLQNAHILGNEENFFRHHYDSPIYRMRNQGVEVFEPAHDVFGGQTGYQAGTNRYIFKDAFWATVNSPDYYDDTSDPYTLEEGGPELTWYKNWEAVIPQNANGDFVVGDVATWLWNRFIGDGGKNFDPIARAQVQALLAHGQDFAYTVDPGNPDEVYSTNDIVKRKGVARPTDEANAAMLMNGLSQFHFNRRVGLAVNFIGMTPYAFAMEGK